MEPATSRAKKLKSPDASLNAKNCITCTNVPESLLEANAAKKHFSKFGRVQRIRLFIKRQMCMIEYDQPISVEKAVLNAGAYDGFMFDVVRTKPRIRRRSSKKEDDPEWLPDEDVEGELAAMRGAPTYRVTRQKPMELEESKPPTPSKRVAPTKTVSVLPKVVVSQPPPPMEARAVAAQPTTLSTSEAAAELVQLRAKTSLTVDEQWRTLDARDRILRAWGGAGARVRVGGAVIGTCRDMCPEKERLLRQAEHQVMTLESLPGADGALDARRAVKQYSRSSADQEMPMCYELRPAAALRMTCAYLLTQLADTTRQVTLADWFHFMWDRFRGIRKDITQQALCCSESISLVEMCARFHAHCAARLADLEHTQFDPKLNTDNLTKCLQTLKHMYADVGSDARPREAEFRGYIALLNLGDSNFWWEIKQLPEAIQKSEPITFAMKVFNALDNNNYVRFFRLVRERATYLQACILLRYFNDVRARGLARIVKAYAPRGGSRYPAYELINSLAFENYETMISFINHYGLRCAKTDDEEHSVILDRNQFIEDSDPYPLARELSLIESKRQCSVGEVIAGGETMSREYENHALHSSFDENAVLKESALTGEDLGYNTLNDTNKDLNTLKLEIQRLSQGNRSFNSEKSNLFVKLGPRSVSPKPPKLFSGPQSTTKQFSFKPAIPVAPIEVIKTSPEKLYGTDTKSTFSFSKPEKTVPSSVWTKEKDTKNVFKTETGARSSLFGGNTNTEVTPPFGKPTNAFQSSQNLFKGTIPDETNVFTKKAEVKSAFGSTSSEKENRSLFAVPTSKPTNLFTSGSAPASIFAKKAEAADSKPIAASIFGKTENNVFAKPDAPKFEKVGNLFSKPSGTENDPKSIFGSVNIGIVKPNNLFGQDMMNKQEGDKIKSLFTPNGEVTSNKLSPGTLFKSVAGTQNGTETNSYSIFQSKNETAHNSVATNIFNSINAQKTDDVYNFVDNQDEVLHKHIENKKKEEEERLRRQEELKIEQERKQALARQEEERRLEAIRKTQEETKRLQELEKRKKEEVEKQAELKRKLEEEKRKAEQAKKAQEIERYREQVNMESAELIEELVSEVNTESVLKIMKEEMDKMKCLMSFADEVHMEILVNLCNEICTAEAMAEKFLSEKLMRKWFTVWRRHFMRNTKRRRLLDNTPVWIPEHTPDERASLLRRFVEKPILNSMNAFHRGCRFTGELKSHPAPDPYNIMEVIKSPLLKRMNQIHYPYDKCFFWKLTLVSPGSMKWLNKKVQIEKWILDAFSDKKKHDVSDSLIHVGRQSWNNLMNFAISVSLANKDNMDNYNEALEGTNGILFYATEEDNNLMESIENTIKQKYPYQVIPVAIIMPKLKVDSLNKKLDSFLNYLKNNDSISCFRIFSINPECVHDSLYAVTRSAMKWLAKNYPTIPPLEIDCLKSLCQRYLGNEIWCKLRLERETHIRHILKDLNKLVKIYNVAVDKLTATITNEDLFNYPSFALEFQQYLNENSPYPKPIEFINSNVKTSENISAIKDMMKVLRLPEPHVEFHPTCISRMHDGIRTYCSQIGWFKDPEEVACKVVALLPNEFSDVTLLSEQFGQYFERYDMLDILNIIVYEKISSLNNFENRHAIYEKKALEAYRNLDWMYETDVVCSMKHRALDYEDQLDYVIEAKRRKIANDSLEYLMLEDKDMTIVEENITATADKISQYSNCHEAVRKLEEQLDDERKRSLELENILRAALGND